MLKCSTFEDMLFDSVAQCDGLADGRLERSGRAAQAAHLQQQHSSTSEYAPSACIILIGDELLAGKISDANLQFLAVELHSLGWKVLKVLILGDDVDSIARCAQRHCVCVVNCFQRCCSVSLCSSREQRNFRREKFTPSEVHASHRFRVAMHYFRKPYELLFYPRYCQPSIRSYTAHDHVRINGSPDSLKE
jgi:hypothetical protein